MAKQELYAATRSGGRLGSQTRERLVELFSSVGHYEGAPEYVVEVVNLCLEKGWRFMVEATGEAGLRVTRF